MSDIVERLRRTLSDLPGNDDDLFNEIHAQRDEAADEIERLHAREARLRGALEKIASAPYPDTRFNGRGMLPDFDGFKPIARAALGEEEM